MAAMKEVGRSAEMERKPREKVELGEDHGA